MQRRMARARKAFFQAPMETERRSMRDVWGSARGAFVVCTSVLSGINVDAMWW